MHLLTFSIDALAGALTACLILWTIAHIAGRIAARLGDMNR